MYLHNMNIYFKLFYCYGTSISCFAIHAYMVVHIYRTKEPLNLVAVL